MAEVHQANLDRKRIGVQRWHKAERVAEQIVAKFQPTNVADKNRFDIIVYLQELIRRNLDCNVLSYGSVPLRTYLPNGDIDLTVCGVNDDNLIQLIASLLESERKNTSQKFVIKDVQLIKAQVKIVKCIVQDIVVDITINQIGGICTLCFLEHVDRVIGKNHLFKKSIILIKTWCYYESRTLGAHAGLLSTYGLEILVLYIFNVFHRSLYGPLSVLHKFLEYFGTFDWDNYFISLIGPVRISSLPEIIAERPPNSHDLLLRGDFLRYCFHMYSVPTRSGNGVPVKHLNIIDPLKYGNNVGRSVSKANSFRIRSAFRYGARNLGRILMAQEDNMVDELHKFFSNTTTIHTVGKRLDLSHSGAEKTFNATASKQPRICNDQNAVIKNSISGNRYSRERKDVSTLTLKPLDLIGDLNTHLASLEHARRWYMLTLSTLQPPPPPPPPSLSHHHHPVPAAQWMPPLIPLRKPFLHRNRQQNRNQRPINNVGCKGKSPFYLKNDDDFPPLTSEPDIKKDVCWQDSETEGKYLQAFNVKLVH